MYPYRKNNINYNNQRFFPAAPFLLGALTGGVAVAAFNPRPRPIINQGYYPYPMYQSYGSYNYGGYYPY